MRLACYGLALVATVGCAANSGGTNPEIDGGGSGDGGGGNFTTLISRSWSINAGVFDLYECTRIQVPRDMWISGFRQIETTATSSVATTAGTHHQILTVSPSSASLGEYECSAQTAGLETQMLYAAGIGTNDAMMFPTGYAVHLKAGTYINLDLHLFNAGDTTLSGTSGIQVQELPAGSTPKEIDFLFAGSLNFTIPYTAAPTSSVFNVTGGCVVPADWEIFALWPHMHGLADHQKVQVFHGNDTVNPDMLLDTHYVFGDEAFYPKTYQMTGATDQLHVTCSYYNNQTTNPLGTAVSSGNSALDEECISGFYKYPAGDPTGNGPYGCIGNQ